VGFFRAAQADGHQPAALPVAFAPPPILPDLHERFLPPAGYHVPVMASRDGIVLDSAEDGM